MPVTHLDSPHKWVVAVVKKLQTKLSQVETNAKCRPASDVRVYNRSTILWSFSCGLVTIKLYVVDGFQRVVVDEIAVGNRLDIRNNKSATEC